MHLVSSGGAAGLVGGRGRSEVGLGVHNLAEGAPGQQGPCLCRRNGQVGLSGMAIADITLLSGFYAERADLEKVWPVTQRDPVCPQEPCPSSAAPPPPCRC